MSIGAQFPHFCLSRSLIQKAKQDNFKETYGNPLLQNLSQVANNKLIKTWGQIGWTLGPHGFVLCVHTKNMVIVTFIPFHPLTHGILSDQVLQLLQVLWWIPQPALLPDPGDSLVNVGHPKNGLLGFRHAPSIGFIPSWTVSTLW
jgi:hypothetical protein